VAGFFVTTIDGVRPRWCQDFVSVSGCCTSPPVLPARQPLLARRFLLARRHRLVAPDRLEAVDAAFFTSNGVLSVAMCSLFVVAKSLGG
jgi:hypothetical protein